MEFIVTSIHKDKPSNTKGTVSIQDRYIQGKFQDNYLVPPDITLGIATMD